MDCHIFACETMVWRCFSAGHEDLFQGNFANNNIRLEGFVTVHDEN